MNADPGPLRPGADHQVGTRVQGSTALITLGDGTRRNALTDEGWTRLAARVSELGADARVKAIHVRGRAGMFSAGSDVTEWHRAEQALVEGSFARMESAFRAVEECPVPVVAEIHGVAAGAGCQLALACDLRFMADSARIGMPIVRLGILSSAAFAERLVAVVGPSVARRLLYTGELLDAAGAVASGAADLHLPAAELSGYTEQTLARIADQPTRAIRSAKRAVNCALAPTRSAARSESGPTVDAEEFQHAVARFVKH